jgi:Core-2/I-Branching enzyme
MKVAFLVLNHRHPTQLVRLLTTLRSQLPDSPIVVHHDIFHGELPSALVEPIGDVHLLASGKRMAWGDSSIIEASCWSLTWMREHLEFDWVVLLSAQDYPIKPLADLGHDLTRDGADAVFRGTPISQLKTAAARRTMRRRYLFQYRPAAAVRPKWLPDGLRGVLRRSTGSLIDALNILQPLFKVYRLPDRMPYRFGWRARNTPFSRDWPCWQGSQWFALSRGALEYALDYMADHPEYVDYYRRTIIPDESMLTTIIFNSADLRISNRSMTYTRWSNSKSGHPDVFCLDDLPDLLAARQYFARKFDIDKDSRVLDQLDDYISVKV